MPTAIDFGGRLDDESRTVVASYNCYLCAINELK